MLYTSKGMWILKLKLKILRYKLENHFRSYTPKTKKLQNTDERNFIYF